MIDKRYTPVALKNTNFFKPLKLNSKITLKHRGVMAPLTRFRADFDHVPRLDKDYLKSSEWKNFLASSESKIDTTSQRGLVEEYYYQRSLRPGTLVLSEATYISPAAGGDDFIPGIWNKTQVNAWKQIINTVHQNKSFFFLQLWNIGRQANPKILRRDGFPYLSASGVYNERNDFVPSKKIAEESNNVLRACTIEEIENFKKDYVNATKNALEAGADGVEIHAANGYLLNQFLDLGSNKRTDQYGPQSFENRSRFLFEVYDLLAKEFGSEKIGLRLSPYGVFGGMTGDKNIKDTNALYAYIYDEFEKRRQAGKGPVYISIMEPRCADITKNEGSGALEGVSNDYIFDHYKGVVIRAGDLILGNQFTKEIVDQNDRTLCMFGRYFISNPDLIDRLENEWPVNKYNRNTFYTRDFKGYVDYPYYKIDK